MTSRLSLALDKGLLKLPSGPVGFWNAPDGFEPPLDDALLSQGFAPWYDRLHARGLNVTPTPEGAVAASVVFCHRSKEATLDLLAQAFDLTADGGLIALEGDKTGGVDSIIKAIRPLEGDLDVFAKSHGKFAWFSNPETAPEYWMSEWSQTPDGFWTWPGIFSSDGVDKGSAVLAAHLPPLKGTVADLGAGWGYLSHTALERSPRISQITLLEADFQASQAAKRNISDDRATILWADIHAHNATYDTIICNPPFHTSRKPDPEIGRAFLRKAAALLTPKGEFWCVANRTLPYESTLRELFRGVEAITESSGFKVFHARIPTVSKLTRPASQGRVT